MIFPFRTGQSQCLRIQIFPIIFGNAPSVPREEFEDGRFELIEMDFTSLSDEE